MTKKIAGIKEIAHLYTNYFFDLDGVLWKGEEAVPGSFEVLNFLRKQNKNLYFITNSSVRGRDQLINKFSKFDFKASLEECFPTTYFSTLYLKQKYPQIKRIMIFGSQDLAGEFSKFGFDVKHVQQLPPVNNPNDLLHQFLDLTIQAIVVGWDPKMTFMKQCLIGFHLQHGIKFFGTNPDKYTMIGSYKVPGAGSIIAGIQQGFNCKAEIIGKPNTFIIDHIIKERNLDKKQSIMIGDNRDTDIKFGIDAGIATMCVLSGVTKREQLTDETKLHEKSIPNYYSECLYQ